MSNLGALLKNQRRAKKLSIKEVATSADVSDTTISNIEQCKTKIPRWDVLCKIAPILGLHPIDILKEAGYLKQEELQPVLNLIGIDKLSKNSRTELQNFIDYLLFKEQHVIQQSGDLKNEI